MRSVMRLLLLLVGLLLLVPFLYVSGYELLVLRRSDVMAGIRPLAVMPIGDLSPSKEVTMEFTVPSDRQWERLRKAFGTPMLLVAAVNARLGVPAFHRVYQSGEIPLDITVSSQRGTITPVATSHAPALYSSEYGSSARLFAAGSGDRIHLSIRAREHVQRDGEVVVVADWPSAAIVDASAAFGFVDRFWWITVVAAILGAACVYLALRPRAPRT